MRRRANKFILCDKELTKQNCILECLPSNFFKNRKLRLAFAEAHQNWTVEYQAKNVHFSDGLFGSDNLFGSNGKKRVLRPNNTRYKTKYTKKSVKHGTSAMVWGCFSAFGTGPKTKLIKLWTALCMKILWKMLCCHMLNGR